jgi:hypothetical protein
MMWRSDIDIAGQNLSKKVSDQLLDSKVGYKGARPITHLLLTPNITQSDEFYPLAVVRCASVRKDDDRIRLTRVVEKRKQGGYGCADGF